MASALDTLCGQAYGGRRYNLLGIYKQRAMLLLTLVSVPLAIIWFYTGEILLLFGQDADIAADTLANGAGHAANPLGLVAPLTHRSP
jgi:MATE family multidrug resistance protein